MEKILELKNIFKIYSKDIRIQNINFTINENECVSLIGESGCGKSTLAKIIVGLTKQTKGNVLYRGTNIENFHRKFLSSKIQMIFQSPYSSLNPRCRVKDIVCEGVRYNKTFFNGLSLEEYALSLLKEVDLDETYMDKFPFELSGGQRQRVSIARAIAIKPEIIIADEVLSALDMITQYQILNLFEQLKKTRNLSILFISHDISIVKKISDKIIVMHKGEIVETNKKIEIFNNPNHYFTKELIKASNNKII